jgi:hypothetical protein
VLDGLDGKRKELNRDFQLKNYESDAGGIINLVVSYVDQISKVSLKIGADEEQAKRLLREHQELVKVVEV